MSPTDKHDDLIPEDTAADDSVADTLTGLPLTQDELQDLLYGQSRSTEERLDLLRAFRSELADREGSDFGDDDPGALIAEIDGVIAELTGAERDGERPGALDIDPLAHRETLSPDSDELEDLLEADDNSLDADDADLAEELEEERKLH